MGMYGGGSSAGSDLRNQQQDQETRIARGQKNIDAVFAGTHGVNPVSNWEKNIQYYDKYGQPIERGARPPEGQFFAGTETSGGFDKAFYAKRAQDYENYAFPQLQQQYQKTVGNTTYGLARSGLLKSGAADYLNRNLQTEMTAQKQGLANAGIQQSQALEAGVNQQKNQITAQLQASADPSTAAQQATAAASQFRAPSAFAPIGGLFNNWSNAYLTNRLANAYAPVTQQGGFSGSYGAPSASTSPGFGAPLGAASMIR